MHNALAGSHHQPTRSIAIAVASRPVPLVSQSVSSAATTDGLISVAAIAAGKAAIAVKCGPSPFTDYNNVGNSSLHPHHSPSLWLEEWYLNKTNTNAVVNQWTKTNLHRPPSRTQTDVRTV